MRSKFLDTHDFYILSDIKLLKPLQGVIYKIIETVSALFILRKNKDSRNHIRPCLSPAHDTYLYH
jgi:hypothetical protein